ncbi:hypothetical protein MOSE0_D04522 [Monosporozyma servazzii]
MTRLNKFIGFPQRIKAIVFDMDGTLCLPQPWMFPAMRQAIGLTDKNTDILQFIEDLPTPEDKLLAEKRIHDVEIKAMEEMEPQPGLSEVMRHLTLNNYSKNICTRNKLSPVNYLINRFIPTEWSNFDNILTRDFRPTKPNPDPLLHIAKLLSVEPQQIIIVGDSFDDIKSGRSAGCFTILLKNHVNEHLLTEHEELIDLAIDNLNEIIHILQGEETVAVSPA